MKKIEGINSSDVKKRNRGLAIKLIATGQVVSRAELAKKTGLARMTVTNIIAELIQNGWLTQKEEVETRISGRNPIAIGINDHAPKIIGIYLSRDSLNVSLADLKCNILVLRSLSLYNESETSLTKKLYELIDEVQMHTKDKILGIGVAAIGPLDTANGIILSPTNFFGIKNYHIASVLNIRTGLPVFVMNDMDACALAEKLIGEGKDLQSFVYLGISNGVGAGIISSGHLYCDNVSSVGEVGHSTIKYDGELCPCGNRGCLEVYVNFPTICKRLGIAVGKEQVTGKDFSCFENDERCEKIFDDIFEKLTYGLINLANLLNPETIFIGHEAAYFPLKYLDMMEKELNRRTFFADQCHICIRRSTFKENAPIYGSLCIITDRLFKGNDFLE